MSLLDLIGGVIKPITQPVTDILDFANLNKYAAGNEDLKNFNPSFSSKEDFDKSLGQYGADPLGTGVQRAAGLGSAFVPGGAGIGGMAASGALAGGLQGLSSADSLRDPNLLQNVALGAGTGGAAGGVLGFLGNKLGGEAGSAANTLTNTADNSEGGILQNIGKDLKNTGNEIQLKDLGIKATKKTGLNYTGAVDNEVNSLASSLEKEGLPISHEGISGLAEKVGNARDDLLRANVKSPNALSVDANELLNSQSEILRRRGGIDSSEDARALLQDELDKIAQSKGISGEQHGNDLYRKYGGTQDSKNNFKLDAYDLQDVFSKTRDASEKVGAGKTVGNDIKAQALLHDFAGDQLKSIPGYAEHNKTFFSLNDQLNNLRSNYNNKGDFTLSKRGLLEKGLGKLKNTGGKIMSSVGGVLENGAPNLAIPKGLQNVAGQAGAVLTNPGTQNVISRIAANAATQPGQPAQSQSTQFDQLPNNAMSQGIGQQQSSQPSRGLQDMSRQELAQAALSFGLKPNDIKFLLDTFKPEADPKQLAAQQDQQNAIQSLSDLSSQVDQNGSRFGAIQGSGLGDFFGNTLGLDPERSALQTQIGLVNQTIGKALEGKSLTDKDRAFYKTLLPTLQDNPEAAKAKIAKLTQIIGTTGL